MRLLIIAASGRSIAESLAVGDFRFDVLDFFSDWDLKMLCGKSEIENGSSRCWPIASFQDTLAIVPQVRCDAAIVAGGIEGHPMVLQSIGEQLCILGAPVEQLARLIDPASFCTRGGAVGAIARQSGVRWPHSQVELPELDSKVEWLVKDVAGSGGAHIRRLTDQLRQSLQNDNEPMLAAGITATKGRIFQQFVRGQSGSLKSLSALFLSATDSQPAGVTTARFVYEQHKMLERLGSPIPSPANQRLGLGSSGSTISLKGFQVHLIGCSNQLVGTPQLTPHPFGYCGSIGPLDVTDGQRARLQQVAEGLAAEYQLRGLFGVDLLIDDHDLWLVDINPRIPASFELFEHWQSQVGGHRVSLIESHLQACLGLPLSPFVEADRSNLASVLGKGILFNGHKSTLQISHQQFNRLIHYSPHRENGGGDFNPSSPIIRDIPHPGTMIGPGDPIATLFVRGAGALAAEKKLLVLAAQLAAELGI